MVTLRPPIRIPVGLQQPDDLVVCPRNESLSFHPGPHSRKPGPLARGRLPHMVARHVVESLKCNEGMFLPTLGNTVIEACELIHISASGGSRREDEDFSPSGEERGGDTVVIVIEIETRGLDDGSFKQIVHHAPGSGCTVKTAQQGADSGRIEIRVEHDDPVTLGCQMQCTCGERGGAPHPALERIEQHGPRGVHSGSGPQRSVRRLEPACFRAVSLQNSKTVPRSISPGADSGRPGPAGLGCPRRTAVQTGAPHRLAWAIAEA